MNVEALRENDQEAWTEFVEETQGEMQRVARWEGVPSSDVEDVAQDAYLKLFQGRASLEEEGNVKGLLRTISRNRAKDIRRRGTKGAELFESNDDGLMGAVSKDNTEKEAISHATFGEMQEVFSAASENYQALIRLTTEGIAQSEIAQTLEKPLGTVKSQLGRARRDLQPVFEEYK